MISSKWRIIHGLMSPIQFDYYLLCNKLCQSYVIPLVLISIMEKELISSTGAMSKKKGNRMICK